MLDVSAPYAAQCVQKVALSQVFLDVGVVQSVWRFSTTYAQRGEQAYRRVLMAFCDLMDLSREHGHNRLALVRVAPIAVQAGKE